ncbi:FMN-binding negative transcriptional regulator [Streptomyces sp. NPDC017405]|uniref:FMN-binding negative transcriptional regulator n=1 Tax=unclassified Streptomyces TaxID=2593676 RepID=UPI0037934858
MFVPKVYQSPDTEAVRLIREYPLALLLTNGPAVPFATHLPVIFPPTTEPEDIESLSGVTLHGHLNRANPHWETLYEGQHATLVFQGPNAYVSAAVYERTPAAPTWNFATTHVQGRIHPMPAREDALDVVRWTVAAFEAKHGLGWDPGPSLDYFDKIVDGVGAFRFTVESVDTMLKLSQEQADHTRDKVVAHFAASPVGLRREVSDLMRTAAPTATTGE